MSRIKIWVLAPLLVALAVVLVVNAASEQPQRTPTLERRFVMLDKFVTLSTRLDAAERSMASIEGDLKALSAVQGGAGLVIPGTQLYTMLQGDCAGLQALIDSLEAEIAALRQELEQYRAAGGSGESSILALQRYVMLSSQINSIEEDLNEIEEEVKAINEGGDDTTGIPPDCGTLREALDALQAQLNTLAQQIAELGGN